jgi:hypothetical protein
MTPDQLAADEPLSPELVLVLPPELRAQALARLGEPVWPKPRPRPRRPSPVAPLPANESFARSLGKALGTRVLQLALIFAAVTIVTLALSAVASAFH